MEPGLYADIGEADYHGHKGSLSTSMAKQLLPPSCPAKFKANLGKPWIKTAFDFGHVVHTIVLGKGDEIAVLDFDSRRTNAYKDAEKAARAAKKTPILIADYEHAEAVAASVLANPSAAALFSNGTAEQSAFWVDEETGILRRARFDFLPDAVAGQRLNLPDLKTADSSEPEAFGKKAASYEYPMQAAAYVDAAIALGLDDDPLFWFVAVEKEAPYIVTVSYADEDTLQIGRHLNRKALRIYAECVATDHWPTYQPEPAALWLPAWYQFENQDAFEMEL